MSRGYKEQCLFDGAVAMWSFDGDQFDRGTLEPLGTTIINEVDNDYPATVNSDSPYAQNMFIGQPGQVFLEQANQFGARFGGQGAAAVPQIWPRTYLSIPHHAAIAFPNNGSFSVEFMVQKDNESAYGTWTGTPYWSKYSPVIRKSGVFTIQFYHDYSGFSQRRMIVTGPLAAHTIYFPTVNMEVNTHVVLTWNLVAVSPFEFRAEQRTYANNRLLGSTTQTYYDSSYPSTNVNSPVEIGGFTTEPNGTRSDRNTSAMRIDQISIYDFALTHTQIANHFQKTLPYRDSIIKESPTHFWDCNDIQSASNNIIVAGVGGRNGTLFGSTLRNQPGPTQFPSTGALTFGNTGIMHVQTTANGGWTPFQNISGDYTFEFWFRSAAVLPASLMNMLGISPDFDGWDVTINSEDGAHSPGSVQFTERRGVGVIAYGSYNDDQWHHLAVRRSSSTIDLFMDGTLMSRATAGLSALSAPGQLIFFGGNSPSRYAGPGGICYIAIYNYALAAAQIQCRSLYDVVYEIKGAVTLQGNPFSATLRFYNSKTGELVDEIESDGATGEYRIVLPSNAEVDILVFDKYNKNVRYRAYGPVSPAGFEDYPISI